MENFKKILIFSLFIFTSAIVSKAQGFNNLFEYVQQQNSPNDGQVVIHQDAKIYKAVNEHVYKLSHEKGIMGYRIRIESKSGSQAREQIMVQRSKFLKRYPDINTYIDVEAPFFKLYVGDYRRRNDALKLFNEIKAEFPGAFIVSTRINLPKLENQHDGQD